MAILTRIDQAKRQWGAVLLLVTFSLVVLFGLAALVLDVGRLYIVKSQLQNAADAGALRAALALNTGLGLTAARAKGAEAALKNAYLLVANPLQDNGVEIDIKVAMTHDAPPEEWVAASGTENPNGYYFAKVTTTKTGIPTFFAGIVGILDKDNGANAVAVAGRYHIDVMPIAICTPDISDCPPNKTRKCGFLPGLSYPVSKVNPIGPGTWYWIDPEATGPGCSGCKYTSADDMRPYLCAGKEGPAVSGLTGSVVCTNTGKSSGPSLSAIDSRFGDYAPQGQCTPEVGPPDTNVMEYIYCEDKYKKPKEVICTKPPPTGTLVADWMKPDTVTPAVVVNTGGQALQQSAAVTNKGGDPQPPPMTITNDGVVWSFVPPEDAPLATRDKNSSYPISDTPYAQTSGKYHADPPSPGYAHRKAGRRILNMLIVRCHTAGGNCRDAEVEAIGEFLLTRKASDADEMYVEFKRIVPIGEFQTEIKLYQ
jgi:Flp pilus assembly protein TadG